MSSLQSCITANKAPTTKAKLHTKNKPHLCSVCNKHFGKRGYLLNHMAREHREQVQPEHSNRAVRRYPCRVQEEQKARLKCKMCSSFFVKEKTLSTHMMKFHFLIKCPDCDEHFTQKAGLRLHQNTCHTKILPKHVLASEETLCPFCATNLGTKNSMIAHVTQRHSGLKCASCGQWCKGATGLNIHRHKCRSSQRDSLYKCHICQKSFAKCANLLYHVNPCLTKNLDNGQQLALSPAKTNGCVCKLCGKSFVSKSSLNGHLTHCMKRYKCSICSKGYSMQSDLDRHVSIFHTGEKPYLCNKCGKRFPHTNLLKVHIEVVHKQNNLNSLTGAKKKMHKCLVCRKAFPQQSFLKMHMRIHTNEKKLKCGICGEKFSSEKAIIEHINLFHVPGGCQGDTGDIEYIVECVDSWDQQLQLPPQVKQETSIQSRTLANESMATVGVPRANPQPTLEQLAALSSEAAEEKDELRLNLSLSSSSSTNSSSSSHALSKQDASYQNHSNNEVVSYTNDPLSDQHLPQFNDTIAAKETSSQDKLLQEILENAPQDNSFSVSNHLNLIKGTCENDIVETQNVYASLPSILPCIAQEALQDADRPHGEQDSSSSYTYPEQQTGPAGTGETDSSLTVSVDDGEDEDYYVTINEYCDEDDESTEGQITDEQLLATSETSMKKADLDLEDVDDDCSTVPDIQGYSLRDLHGFNGENFIEMALTCQWENKQTELDANCNEQEHDQNLPLKQEGKEFLSHCKKSSVRPGCREECVQHVCGICQRGFQSFKELQQHKASSHSLKCAQCKQQYSKMIDLLNHYESCTYSNLSR